MPDNLQEKVKATIEGRRYNSGGAFNAPITEKIVKGIPEVPSFIGGAISDFQAESERRAQALPDYLKPFAPFIRGLDLSKTIVQETAAGASTLVKSVIPQDAVANAPRIRTEQEQKELERSLFGRETQSIQEGYVEPTRVATNEAGSGIVERTALPIAAGIAGVFFESPFGRLRPTKSRGVIMKLLKDDLGTLARSADKRTIEEILRARGAGQVSLDTKAVDSIIRATSPKQVAKALDEAEFRFVKNAKKAEQIQEAQSLRRGAGTAARTSTQPAPTTPASDDIARSLTNAQRVKEAVKASREGKKVAEKESLGSKVFGVDEVIDTSGGIISTKQLSKAAKNSLENKSEGVRQSSLDAQSKSLTPDKIPEREVEVRVIEDGSIDIVDGRHLLEVARNTGIENIKIKDVTKDFFPEGVQVPSRAVRKTTGPGATRSPEEAGRGEQAPAGATRSAQSEQPVSPPSKTTSNSPVLDSLQKSNPKKAKMASAEYNKFKQAFDKEVVSKWSKIREIMQDSFISVRKLQQQVADGADIPDDINIDQAETLFHGRVHTALEDVKTDLQKIDASITANARRTGVSVDEMRTDVDSYLHAIHAPERNARLGDGAAGITNKQAEKTIEALKGTGRFEIIKAEAEKLLELNKKTIKIALDAQLLDKETADLLQSIYKNHVPLMRVMEETTDLTQALSGKGFSVKSSGLKKAKGSDKEVADIAANIAQNVQQVIIRAEKNLVNLTALRWAREHAELGILKEVKPKAIGKGFDGESIILENIKDKPEIIALREKGKPVYLEVQDGRLATALKGVNVEQIHTLLKPIAFLTRMYGQLHTRFNYEFAFSNNIRDIQEMAVDVASRKGMGFGAAGESVRRDLQSKKAVFDFIKGTDSEGSRLYKQMKDDGGTTGGLGLSTRREIDIEIEKIRKTNESNPRKAAEMFIRGIDKWNMIFEDASRLSVYRTALGRGLTRKQAAVLAKESTINFNKKGTGGPFINGIWMFSNASIQGTTKILRAMKNPKVAAATTATIGAAVFSANEWNDSIDPEWRDKVTKYDRSSNLVVVLPTDDGSINYVTVPISWGLKPIKMTMEYLHDLAKGEVDPLEGFLGILLSVAQSYNPLAGDESLLRTATPTVLKTPVEIASNRGWHGNQIKPAYDINAPASSQYYESLGDSFSGEMFINLTEFLSNRGIYEISPADIDYAFNQYIGGVGRSIDKLVTTVSHIGSDEPVPSNERPILSRFFKTRSEEQVYNDLFYSRREQADKEKARERILNKREVQPIYEEVQILIDEGKTQEAQRIVDSLTNDQYETYRKLKASDTRRQNVGAQIEQYTTVREVEELMEQGKFSDAQRIVDGLSDEEYKAYKKAKEVLGVSFE